MLRTLHSVPGQPLTTTASLAAHSTNALQLFADLAIIAPESGDAQGVSADFSIEQQHERLVLWASNLGATHLGHSSLDYRLRQADLVRNAIEAFLNDLCGSLLECRELLLYGDLSAMDDVLASPHTGRSHGFPDGTVAAAQQIMLEADYGSESDSPQEQDFSLILESIAETINCLYKIATRIRNPATRTLTKKVLEFALIDRETGVDLTEEYALLDREHLREVFRDYRSADDMSPPEEQGISPQDLSSALAQPLDFLAQRLAQANTIRRKQFAYWSRHRMKLDVAPEAAARVVRVQQLQHQQRASQSVSTIPRSVHIADSVVLSLPTTATTLDPAQIDLEDTKSVVTISDYTESVRGVSTTRREVSEIPEPPSKLKGQRYFECPYCLTLCSGKYLGKKAWRTHLLRDLRPYVCTYRDCAEATCLFDTRQEWVAHEDSCHRRIWRCLEHPEATFPTVVAYKDHIRDVHASNRTELESAQLLRVGESVPEVADRPCPICFADIPDATALQQHIAAHLIRIALFSLPRSTGADGDTESGTSWSGRADGHHSDSCQVTSGESSNSSAHTGEGGKGVPKDEVSGKTTDLSHNTLQHLEKITSDQGSNAKVERFLLDLTEPDLEDQPSKRSFPPTPKLVAKEENGQSPVADEAGPTNLDMTSPAKASAEDTDTGRDEDDWLLVTMGKLSKRWDELHARGYASSPDRLSDIEPLAEATRANPDSHVPQQDSDRPRTPATETSDDTDRDFYCEACGEILSVGKAFELAGKRWHVDCFKCNNCHTFLDSDQNILLLNDGSLRCDKCIYECTVCGNKIEDTVIVAGEKAYCAACFQCRNCKRKIENLRYAATSQGNFCMDCHDALMERRRKKAIESRKLRVSKQAVTTPPLPTAAASTSPSSPTSPQDSAGPSQSHGVRRKRMGVYLPRLEPLLPGRSELKAKKEGEK